MNRKGNNFSAKTKNELCDVVIKGSMQTEIKILLKKYNYSLDDKSDPNNYDKSVQLTIKQTELLYTESL
ncbi:MAG: hypothetical protein WC123_07300 [Bacilli bacterium]